MGSGKNRKENDQPIIRRPMKRGFTGIEAPGDNGSVVADICLPSFEQRVKKSSLTVQGIPVRLQKEGNGYAICIGENIIGMLSAKNSVLVTKCSALGVKYIGKIVVNKSNAYAARFTRISR
ncbi:MAG TPA: hypothetical protein VHD35_08315 [Chitinophagaceae bacterium]|jgi:hypothetical protein|nr:hypothetical protein [Chitinophagaceae bacterium]